MGKMHTFVLLQLLLFGCFSLVSAFLGRPFLQIDGALHRDAVAVEQGSSASVIFPLFNLDRSRRHSSSAHAPSSHSAFAPLPSVRPRRRHGHHRHHHVPVVAAAPSPSEDQGCDQFCEDPFTTAPFGSPCGCVLPMKVRILLDIAPYAVFPVMNELEAEIASGTYFEQSQVKIMGATADGQNQGKTLIDIDLVPLGEKFDNTTALLTYERLQHKRVPLNATLFGSYEVIYTIYPGLPNSLHNATYDGTGPSASAGVLPMTANVSYKNQEMNPRTIAIIVLSAFVLVLLVAMAVIILLRLKRVGKTSSAVGPAFTSSLNKRSGIGSFLSSSMASSTPVSVMSSMAACMLSVKTFGFSELEKATNKFSSSMILGEGGFGCVFRGIMDDGVEVAIKLLNSHHENGDREFIAEVEMLSRLHHRNLVKLIGICIEGHKRCLVYELVRNGSVESHLHGLDKDRSPLDWEGRLKIALGAARGLAYLHEDSNPRVIHRDFKASNVLLEDDFTPKVSDFGLAREASEGSRHISTRVMGTFGYVAPEYAMTGHLLVKSDVYSYGVMLLELLSGRKPVDMSQPPGQENLVTWARPLLSSREGISQLADPALSGSYDFDDMAKVASIASMCVHQDVTSRPFMGEVVQALKLICNDADETYVDNNSQKESSVIDSDFKGDLVPSDSSWWNAGGISPRLTFGQASSFITMEYSSGSLDEMRNGLFLASSVHGDRLSLPLRHGNRSGPLRTVRSKRTFYKLRGSMSEHGGIFSRRQGPHPHGSHWV